MTLKEFRLPDIGEGIAEGEIVAWKVKPGQSVKEEDEFVEVMTDKATVMITAPYTGVVKELRCKEGDVVPVESVIAVFEVGGAAGASPAAATPAPHAAPTAHAAPVAPATQPAAASAPMARGASAPVEFEQAEPGKVLAAPATRRRARELGVDLHQVLGTGPSGRVTNEDLDRHLSGITLPTSVIPAGQPGTETRIPLRGLRKKIAEHMALSKRTAAHFTYVEEVEVTDLVKFRAQAKESAAQRGVKLTYLPFVLKAIVAGLREFPMLNSSLDEERGEIVVRNVYNFGIAVDTEDGLVVPVVKNVDQRSILDLAREIDRLATAPGRASSRWTTCAAAPSRSRTPATSVACSRRPSSTSRKSRSWASTRSPSGRS
jgi:pyruvate dehydrogenase E2 component (dihydrolipoamide acetyltransferase)